MARLTIDTGTLGNPATGDTLRTAMTKVNSNFAELAGDLQMSGNTLLSADTNGNIILDPNGTGQVQIEADRVVIKTTKTASKLNQFDTNLSLNLSNVKFQIESNDTIIVNYEKESVNFEQLINYLKEKNLKILDISIDEGDLEDVFLQLTKN